MLSTASKNTLYIVLWMSTCYDSKEGLLLNILMDPLSEENTHIGALIKKILMIEAN